MEDFIGQIACGSKSDSIMLRILRSAMDETQELQLQLKHGTIEFLHEQATFYKLAAILVEGCLKIVEDDTSDVLQSSTGKVLSELIEIREWLVGRIREAKHLIMEKDMEFRERLENETRLRKALELRERESVRLYEKLEDEKMILNTVGRARRSRASCPNLSPRYLSEDRGLVLLEDEKMMARRSHSSPNLSSYSLDMERESVLLEDENDERRARRSCASSPNLSLDFLNKERELVELEDEKMILNTTRRARRSCDSSPNPSLDLLNKERGFVLLEDEKMIFNTETRVRNPVLLNKESTLVHLKRMVDLVFGRMQIVEALPLAKKWRRGVEREVESILVKGFVRDLQTKVDIELKKRDGFVKDSWFDFIDEMRNLFQELKEFFSRNDVSNVQSSLARSRRTSSVPNIDVDLQNLLQNDGEAVCGSHHVWKIIKSHESIIRRQREHRRDALHREGASSSLIKRNEDINAMERLIQDAITRLENFAQRKHKVSDLKGVGGRSRDQEKRRRIPKPHRRSDRTSTTIQSFEAEIKKLQEERDGLCFQISVIEDTYQLLFRGVMKDFSIGACCGEKEMPSDELEGSDTYQTLMHYMKSAISEDILALIFKEMVKEWKMSRSDSLRGSKPPQEDFPCSPILDCTEFLSREEIYKIYFKETTEAWRSEALKSFDCEESTLQSRAPLQEKLAKDWKITPSNSVGGVEIPQEEFHCSPISQDCTECLLREEIYKIYFREMIQAWRSPESKQFDFLSHTHQEDFHCSDCMECLLREEIYKIYFRETIQAWRSQESKQFDFISHTPQEDFRCSDCMECLLREEIYKIYFRETIQAWRSSSEEIKQFDFEVRTPQSRRSQSFQEGTPRSRGGDGESSMIFKVDSLLRSLELEEDLMLKASSLIKEHSVSNNLVILNCEELEERDAIEWLITDDESTFCSVSEKLERALQQLHTSKELLAELEESLEVSDGDGEYYENSQFNSILSLQEEEEEEENQTSELELEGVGQGDWTENVLAIVKKFRILVDGVEVELHENLQRKSVRLEALKRQVDALSQPMARIRTRKLLYKKAFISRCRNLKLAETEVDLLGDQVEALLSLLERIYLVLSRDARVLATYFEVYDILKLIKIELNGGTSSKPKSLVAKHYT